MNKLNKGDKIVGIKEYKTIAYPAWIYMQKEITTIDIPDFEIHIENKNESLGEAMETARNYIIQKAEQLNEEEKELPESSSVEYKKSKGAIFTYVDVDFGKLFKKKKSLEELAEEDETKLYTMWEVYENSIEFLKKQKVMSVTFSQVKLANKFQKLAEKYPNEVRLIRKNEDGSVYGKLPVSYLHIYKPGSGPKKEYTEEDKAAFRERITKKNDDL